MISFHFFNFISFRCEGEPSCAVSTSDRSLVSSGDPCPGTPKYLEIHYECERGTRAKRQESTSKLTAALTLTNPLETAFSVDASEVQS